MVGGYLPSQATKALPKRLALAVDQGPEIRAGFRQPDDLVAEAPELQGRRILQDARQPCILLGAKAQRGHRYSRDLGALSPALCRDEHGEGKKYCRAAGAPLGPARTGQWDFLSSRCCIGQRQHRRSARR